MRYALSLALMLLAIPAFAADPSPALQALDRDWQAAATAQVHLLDSIRALATDLQAAEAKLQKLETENEVLRKAAAQSAPAAQKSAE